MGLSHLLLCDELPAGVNSRRCVTILTSFDRVDRSRVARAHGGECSLMLSQYQISVCFSPLCQECALILP